MILTNLPGVFNNKLIYDFNYTDKQIEYKMTIYIRISLLIVKYERENIL